MTNTTSVVGESSTRAKSVLARFGWMLSVVAAVVAVGASLVARPTIELAPVSSDPEMLRESVSDLMARTEDLRKEIGEVKASIGLTYSVGASWPERERIDGLADRIQRLGERIHELEEGLVGSAAQGARSDTESVDAMATSWLLGAAASRDLIERGKADIRNPDLEPRSRAAALGRLSRMLGDHAATELAPVVGEIIASSAGSSESELPLLSAALSAARRGVIVSDEKAQLLRLLSSATLPGVRSECVRGLEKYIQEPHIRVMVEQVAVQDDSRVVRRTAEDVLEAARR